jgi:hypothetical protein
MDTIDEHSDFGISHDDEQKKIIQMKQFIKSPSHGRLFVKDNIIKSPVVVPNSEDVVESELKQHERQMRMDSRITKFPHMSMTPD